MSNQSLGSFGEKLAANYLKEQGYKILSHNFRTKLGELDIIALDADILCAIEVKTRSSRAFGLPEEFINRTKLEKMRQCLEIYQAKFKTRSQSLRLDLLVIECPDNKVSRLELIKNIFL